MAADLFPQALYTVHHFVCEDYKPSCSGEAGNRNTHISISGQQSECRNRAAPTAAGWHKTRGGNSRIIIRRAAALAFPKLSPCSSSIDHNREAERTGGGQWLQGLNSLRELGILNCLNFWAGPEPPLPHEQESPSSSSKLQELVTDNVAGVLAPPICTLLSSSLTCLEFWKDEVVERFTEEQEEALRLLTSLGEIGFWHCGKLQCLPAGLHGLSNLKRLNIYDCATIRSLPKDGLPSSLQELKISYCPAFQSLPKDCLPSSLQKLVIRDCPAIRSLPKDCLPSSLQKLEIYNCPAIRSLPKVNDLPSSLRELHVQYSENEELRRQYRKLIGIIPVVYA